jgi:beta-lactamase class A
MVLNLKLILTTLVALTIIVPSAISSQVKPIVQKVNTKNTVITQAEKQVKADIIKFVNLAYIAKNSSAAKSPKAKYIGLLDTQSSKFQGYNADAIPASLASTAKILVALVVLEDLELGKYNLNSSVTMPSWARALNGSVGSNVKENLIGMLQDSDNNATNALIVKIGGFDIINSKLKKHGFTNSKINCLLSPKFKSNKSCIGNNQSSMRDLVYALNSIRIKNTDSSKLIVTSLKKATNTFNHTNRIYNKYGMNSNALADVGVIEVNDKEYVYSINADFKGTKDSGNNYNTAGPNKPTTLLTDKKDPISKTIQWIVNDLTSGLQVKDGID